MWKQAAEQYWEMRFPCPDAAPDPRTSLPMLSPARDRDGDANAGKNDKQSDDPASAKKEPVTPGAEGGRAANPSARRPIRHGWHPRMDGRVLLRR